MKLLNHHRIAQLDSAPMPEDDGLLDSDRIIGKSGRSTVVYGPFSGSPRPEALIAFVGLTPGYQQLQKATQIAREYPSGSAERAAALRRGAAFGGAMRGNLIAMLDELGLPSQMHVSSTADLFSEHAERMLATSALRYPVFVNNWKNYGGGRDITDEPLFVEMLKDLLAPTLAGAPKALIVPFGDSASRGVLYLAKTGQLDESRVLCGFPHPSGANGHRKRIFEENKRNLTVQLRSWFGN